MKALTVEQLIAWLQSYTDEKRPLSIDAIPPGTDQRNLMLSETDQGVRLHADRCY